VTLGENDAESRARLAAFEEALQALGWSKGRNIQFDYRWPTDDESRLRRHAAELIALAPDVIVTAGTYAAGPVIPETRTIPIVFVQTVDPVGGGFVESMAHPGGNATGFVQFDYSLSAKWLELLKEIAPQVKRVAVIRDPSRHAGIGQYAVIQSVATSHGV